MEEKNIKHSILYIICFFFATLEVLGIVVWIGYMGSSRHHHENIEFVLLLLLLGLYLYYLYSLWRPRQAGVKFFLIARTLSLILTVIYFCVVGFEPWIISIHVLIIEVLLIRAYYKLLLNMPFEY